MSVMYEEGGSVIHQGGVLVIGREDRLVKCQGGVRSHAISHLVNSVIMMIVIVVKMTR